MAHRRELLERFGYWRPHTGWAHDWELGSRWRGVPWVASLLPTVAYTLEDSERGDRLGRRSSP